MTRGRAEAPRTAGSTTDPHGLVFILAVALAVAPFVVGAIADLVRGSGAFFVDQATMEMTVRDVGRHPVMVGLYSRDLWSHPGPAVYYTLAVPYRLFGSNSNALLVGALAINAVAVAGVGVIAKRLGGAPAAFVTLVLASATARALGAEFLHDPWVCFVTVLPFGLFCCLVWAMTAGSVWSLPVAAALASWLAQTHVGYVPLTAPLLLFGAVWLGVVALRSGSAERRRLAWSAAVTIVVLGLLWALPFWDQLFRTGNLGRIVDWFSRAEEGVHSLTEGLRVVFGQFAVAPDWLTGTRRRDPTTGETTLRLQTLWPLLLVLVAAAAIVAWRRGARPVLRLLAVVGVALVTGVAAVSRTIGTMHEYRLVWTWIPAMLGAAAVLWVAWDLVASRWPEAARRVLVPLALAVLLVLGVFRVVDVFSAGRADIYSPLTERVTEQVASELDGADGEVLVRSDSPVSAFYRQGVLLGLERRGFDARSPVPIPGDWPRHRLADGKPVEASLLVVATAPELPAAAADPNLELIAYDGPVPYERRVEQSRRAAAVVDRAIAEYNAGTMSREEFVRVTFGAASPVEAIAIFRDRVAPRP